MFECTKECFANLDGACLCLDTPFVDDCPFQRTDITMKDQCDDIKRYNSKKALNDDEIKKYYFRTR